jgi:hypothetical protein
MNEGLEESELDIKTHCDINILQQFSLHSQREICGTVVRELKGLTGGNERFEI